MPLDSQRSRKNRRADTLSDDTGFSGLPKSYMGYRGSPNGYTANIWNRTYHDIISYNYGGYIPSGFVGAFWSDIIVPEPGLYDLCGQVAFTNGPVGAQYYGSFFVNNLQPIPYVQPAGCSTGVAGATVIIPVNQTRELKQGDAVTLQGFTNAAGLTDATGYTWWSITKRGGQY